LPGELRPGAFLRAHGREEIQGYHISPPRDAEGFRRWLSARR
jgi:EAL domain-containing protein (putative c-di-GMP-specific phosphodiesterase class I)